MKTAEENRKEEIIERCIRGEFKAYRAASRLNISVRQVENLKAKYLKGISFIHGNCGRSSSRALDKSVDEKILTEYQKPEYDNINFTHFTELLNENGHIASYSYVSKVLKSKGFKSPKAKRKTKKIHKARTRRIKFGELVQGDGSPFDYLKMGRNQTLHILVDDATSRLVGLHLSLNECMDGYFEAARYMLENHGTPEAFYFDGLSIFFNNSGGELTIEEELSGVREHKTQFGKICETLGIELIHARSPEAKGRVERAGQTLQSRLPIEFARRGIKTFEAANEFLKCEYIERYNKRFGVNEDAENYFVGLPKSMDLDELLCYKVKRKTDKGGVFSLKNVRFRVLGLDVVNCQIEVLISKRHGVLARFAEKFYDVAPMDFQKKSITSSDSADMILERFVHFFTQKNEHLI